MPKHVGMAFEVVRRGSRRRREDMVSWLLSPQQDEGSTPLRPWRTAALTDSRRSEHPARKRGDISDVLMAETTVRPLRPFTLFLLSSESKVSPEQQE